MRAFNELVFDQTIRGTTEQFSSSQLDELLGRADELVLELECEDQSGGTTPTVTLKHYQSCSGKGFGAGTVLINGASLASLPFREIAGKPGPLAGLGRVGVQLAVASGVPVARIRVWATGRVA